MNVSLRTIFTEAEFNSAGNLFNYDYGRRAFRCDHYYEDGSCYGGPDGGGCSKRKKREELVSRPPEANSSRSRIRSVVPRQKRQTDDGIGCQKESSKGVDYRGNAAEVDGVACANWADDQWADDVEGEHNFCRNPTDHADGVWCKTVANTYGFCNVPKCEALITERYISCSEWHGGRAYWKWDYELPSTCESEFETYNDTLLCTIYNVQSNPRHISEILCQKDELLDLSVRTDVETYDWDGEDVTYYTAVK